MSSRKFYDQKAVIIVGKSREVEAMFAKDSITTVTIGLNLWQVRKL